MALQAWGFGVNENEIAENIQLFIETAPNPIDAAIAALAESTDSMETLAIADWLINHDAIDALIDSQDSIHRAWRTERLDYKRWNDGSERRSALIAWHGKLEAATKIEEQATIVVKPRKQSKSNAEHRRSANLARRRAAYGLN